MPGTRIWSVRLPAYAPSRRTCAGRSIAQLAALRSARLSNGALLLFMLMYDMQDGAPTWKRPLLTPYCAARLAEEVGTLPPMSRSDWPALTWRSDWSGSTFGVNTIWSGFAGRGPL